MPKGKGRNRSGKGLEEKRQRSRAEFSQRRSAQVTTALPGNIAVEFEAFLVCIVFRVCLKAIVPIMWGFSSAGRAPALQAGGQRFDPANLHTHGSLAQSVRALA